MIVIYAEKPDMGVKIAAALDCIHLNNGTDVNFSELNRYDEEIKKQRIRDGLFNITYAGEETIITWGIGHMVGLKQAYDYDESYKKWENLPLPYIPEEYGTKITTPNTAQFCRIKNLFYAADKIICATDDDREGDLIFAYIYDFINCHTPYERALFNKQSQAEFIKAFSPENLVPSWKRQPVIDAGKARSAGDFIVGAGPTVAMSLKFDGNGTLSVGRVQTAVLNMICEREHEIKNFKPKNYWVIKADFICPNGNKYSAEHITKRFDILIAAKEIFNKISDKKEAVISSIEKKDVKKGKPNLYSLATLQMEANKRYGFSLEYTLKIAQSLYDKGYTTYPRTENLFLPEDMMDEMDDVIDILSNNPNYSQYFPDRSEWVDYHTKKYFDNKKVGSHYAIVTTKSMPAQLSKNESLIYDLIAKSVITMIYPDAVLSTTSIETNVDGEKFITKGTTIKNAGYMAVTGIPKEQLLPDLGMGDIVAVKQIFIQPKKTEPPKRYTGASLLVAMINCGKTLEDEELKEIMSKGPDGKPRGLGRPSSQASIVKTLEDRGYIEEQKKSIVPTKKGLTLIAVCPVEDLKSPVMTAKWEKRLDDIEDGKDTYEDFMNDLENAVRKWTEDIMNTNKTFNNTNNSSGNYYCPICRKKMKKVFWGYICSGNDPEKGEDSCPFRISDIIAKKKIPDKEMINLLTKGKTSLIKGFTAKSGNKFDAYLVVDREKKGIAFEFEDNSPKETNLKCLLCGKTLNKMNWGYGCSGYREGCTFALGKISGYIPTESEVRRLLDGKTILVKNLKSKNSGRKYDANISLCLDEEDEDFGKYQFSFPEV